MEESKSKRLSLEDERRINNKLTDIKVSTDRMLNERKEIFKIIKDIQDILNK